jgi:hypothetical protein
MGRQEDRPQRLPGSLADRKVATGMAGRNVSAAEMVSCRSSILAWRDAQRAPAPLTGGHREQPLPSPLQASVSTGAMKVDGCPLCLAELVIIQYHALHCQCIPAARCFKSCSSTEILVGTCCSKPMAMNVWLGQDAGHIEHALDL